MPIAGRSIPIPAIISRNGLGDAPVETPTATPAPVVVTARSVRRPSTVMVARSTLEDPGIEVTPAPWVVTRQPKWTALPVIHLRSSLVDPTPDLAIGTKAPLVSQTRTGTQVSETSTHTFTNQTREVRL